MYAEIKKSSVSVNEHDNMAGSTGKPTSSEIDAAFGRLDLDGSGYLERNELQKMLLKMDFSEDQSNLLFGKWDVDEVSTAPINQVSWRPIRWERA